MNSISRSLLSCIPKTTTLGRGGGYRSTRHELHDHGHAVFHKKLEHEDVHLSNSRPSMMDSVI